MQYHTEEIKKRLKEDGFILLSTAGLCMSPQIKDQSYITVVDCFPKIGEVGLIAVKGKLFAHRIYLIFGFCGKKFVVQGGDKGTLSICCEGDVIGTVKESWNEQDRCWERVERCSPLFLYRRVIKAFLGYGVRLAKENISKTKVYRFFSKVVAAPRIRGSRRGE